MHAEVYDRDKKSTFATLAEKGAVRSKAHDREQQSAQSDNEQNAEHGGASDGHAV